METGRTDGAGIEQGATALEQSRVRDRSTLMAAFDQLTASSSVYVLGVVLTLLGHQPGVAQAAPERSSTSQPKLRLIDGCGALRR
jgi:hypothetical protein